MPSGTIWPVSSATRDEVGRAAAARARVLASAASASTPLDRHRGEVDDRLVVAPRLVGARDAPGAARSRCARRSARAGPQRGVEELHAAAAALLGPVHRGVGVAEQRRRRRRRSSGTAMPMLSVDEHARGRRPGTARPSRLRRARRPRARRPRRSRSLAQHDELVAAEAGDGVAGRARRRAGARRRRRSSSSPAAWPRLSLTTLKWSRSRNSTARRVPWRSARALARASCSSSSTRLGRPVSASWRAWWVSASAWRMRSVRSRAVTT